MITTLSMSFVRNSEEDAHFGTGSYYNYKYNGKELQETGMYDYGARMYMPDIGRWGVLDNYSENYFPISPYSYVANNPAKFIGLYFVYFLTICSCIYYFITYF